jgi:hypothetical protein
LMVYCQAKKVVRAVFLRAPHAVLFYSWSITPSGYKAMQMTPKPLFIVKVSCIAGGHA